METRALRDLIREIWELSMLRMGTNTLRRMRPLPCLLAGLLVITSHAGSSAQSVPLAFDADDPGSFFTPRDRRLQALFDQARRELTAEDGNHREALRSLQQIIDDAEDVFADSSMKTGLREQASRLIASLSPETQALYEKSYGPEAASILQRADVPPSQMRQEVVRRFFHTAAGATAAFELAATHMDAGRLLDAGRLFERLIAEHSRSERFEPALSARCVVCYWMSGEAERAAEMLQRAVSEITEFTLLGRQVPNLNSSRRAISWLTDKLGPPQSSGAGMTPDWQVPRGSVSRNAAVAPVSPLFDDAWTVPLVSDRDAEDFQRVEELATLLEGVTATIGESGPHRMSVLAPLMVGELAVFPSYGHVKAVNLKTGQLRWLALPADQTFVDVISHSSAARRGQLADDMEDFLKQRAWLDVTSSRISSDGERIYCVRDCGIVGGQSSQYSRVLGADHPRAPKSFNALRAYDAFGGRWQWEIGGARARASLPLAGTFFLGPPLPVESTLFVLGEDLGQVRLHALAPQSGEVLWSLPLANADADIDENLDRRLAGLSPTSAGGLLICPTGSGLIVAVDPRTRSLSWATRYRQPQQFIPRQMRRPFIGGISAGQAPSDTVDDLLKQRTWHDSSIIASGTSLVVAPPDIADPEDDRPLLCLNLLDGRILWRRPRQDTLFVGGVHDGTVLLIGDRFVEGISLSDNRSHWTLPLGPPSGRGVRTGARYHLPLASGEIATIDLSSGRLLARSPVRSGRPLGNLVASNGRLLSQTATDVRSFRTLSEVEQQIALDLQADPSNPAAIAARGELHLHTGRTADGLADLRTVVAATDDARSRRLLVETLMDGLRTDFAAFRSSFEELDRLTKEPELHSRFLMTYAAGLVAAAEPEAAFDLYLRLLGHMDQGQPIEPRDGGRWVRRDRYVQGELARLYATADETLQSRLQKLAAARLADDTGAETQTLRTRLLEVMPLPGAAEDGGLRLELASDGPAIRVEAELLKWRRRSEQPALTSAKLVQLYAKHGRGDPVVELLHELETVYADDPCLDDLTGSEWAAKARISAAIADSLAAARTWPTGSILVQESPTNTTPFAPLRFEGPVDPLISRYVFLDDRRGRIAIQDSHGVPVGGDPLRLLTAGRESSDSQFVMQRGHRAVVFVGTQFVLMDLIDGSPRVLLHEPLVEFNAAEAAGLRFRQREIQWKMGFRGRVMESDNPAETGGVGPLNDSIFCFRRGTTLQAHDPFTGQRFWTIEDVPANSEVFADQDFVLLIPVDQNRAYIYRALDGEPLGVRNLPADLVRNRRGAEWGRLFLRANQDDDGTALAMYDPVTDANIWERRMASTFHWAPVDGEDLCVVDSEGLLTLIDARSGDVLLEQTIPLPESVSLINVLSLPDQWLVTTYARSISQDQSVLAPVQMPHSAFPVNGPVTAFSRRSGEVMWTRTIENQIVDPTMPPRWPILSLSAVVHAMPQPQGNRMLTVMSRRIEIIDRITGETLHRATSHDRNQRIDVYWEVADDAPQVTLRQGLVELQILCTDRPPTPADEPSTSPPPPPLPVPNPLPRIVPVEEN